MPGYQLNDRRTIAPLKRTSPLGLRSSNACSSSTKDFERSVVLNSTLSCSLDPLPGRIEILNVLGPEKSATGNRGVVLPAFARRNWNCRASPRLKFTGNHNPHTRTEPSGQSRNGFVWQGTGLPFSSHNSRLSPGTHTFGASGIETRTGML